MLLHQGAVLLEHWIALNKDNPWLGLTTKAAYWAEAMRAFGEIVYGVHYVFCSG